VIIVDINMAFVCGNFDKEIYMDISEGMTGFNKECLLLLKLLYPLVVQIVARQWHR